MGGLVQAMVSSGIAVVVYAVIIAGIYKVFQIATDLAEIKELLRDIKRNTQDSLIPPSSAALPAAAAPQSHEDLLKALESR